MVYRQETFVSKNLAHQYKHRKAFYESLTMLIFKRLESDDEAFQQYFSKIGEGNIIHNIDLNDETKTNKIIWQNTNFLAEMVGIFSAVTR
jgi:hypothetical protein